MPRSTKSTAPCDSLGDQLIDRVKCDRNAALPLLQRRKLVRVDRGIVRNHKDARAAAVDSQLKAVLLRYGYDARGDRHRREPE